MKNKKRILMMAGSIFVVVIVAVVVYFLVRQDSKDPAFSPDLDENAIVQTKTGGDPYSGLSEDHYFGRYKGCHNESAKPGRKSLLFYI